VAQEGYNWTISTLLSTVQNHALALARLPALLNRQTVDKTNSQANAQPSYLFLAQVAL
jgi:hypothetical protein